MTASEPISRLEAEFIELRAGLERACRALGLFGIPPEETNEFGEALRRANGAATVTPPTGRPILEHDGSERVQPTDDRDDLRDGATLPLKPFRAA